jgi:hypothetical protein
VSFSIALPQLSLPPLMLTRMKYEAPWYALALEKPSLAYSSPAKNSEY